MTTPPRARDAVVPLVLTALPIVLGALAVRAVHAGTDVPATVATLLVVIAGLAALLLGHRERAPDPDPTDAAWARLEPQWSGRRG